MGFIKTCLSTPKRRIATMAVLVKASVARKLIERCGRAGLRLPGALHRVDARAHFAASVEAVEPPELVTRVDAAHRAAALQYEKARRPARRAGAPPVRLRLGR